MKKIYIILIASIISINVFAQQSNTMYFMKKTPQNTLLNPAFRPDCKFYIGGLLSLVEITPVLGQVFLPISMDLTNTSFDWNTIVHKGTGVYKDSLIIDKDNFLKALKDYNYLTYNMNIDLLSVGFNVKDYAITFNATEKIDMKLGYTKDFFLVPILGNGDPDVIGRETNLGVSLDAVHYREFAAGVSKPINEKLTVGAKAKVLFGMANINTRSMDTYWTTDADNFDYDFRTEAEINTSLPFLEYFYNDSTGKIDSAKGVKNYAIKDYLLNTKNKGLGIDIGATYQINDKITVAASIVDLGFIRWKNNPLTIVDNGSFTFTGLDIANNISFKNSSDTTQSDGSMANDLLDSIATNFAISDTNLAYTTHLTPKFYVGGTYTLNEKINFGALARVELLKKTIRPSITLSVNTQFKKWLGLTASYSIMNNTFTNAGLGMSIKFGPFKMFLINDNVLGMVFPQTARNINWRTGLFLVFGSNKMEETSKAKF